MIIGTGSLGELIEHYVDDNPNVQGLLIRQLVPLPIDALKRALSNVETVIVAEYNARAQIKSILKDCLQEKEVQSLLRYDGEHWTDEQFASEITQLLNKVFQ